MCRHRLAQVATARSAQHQEKLAEEFRYVPTIFVRSGFDRTGELMLFEYPGVFGKEAKLTLPLKN
ncbi:hypothetical protein CS300_29200, partial [Pseudomonas syringae pv. actinidiae]